MFFAAVGPSTAAAAGGRKRKAAPSPVDEESSKRKAPPVVCQTQVAAPTAASRPTGGRKRKAADALSVAPVVEVLEAAPLQSYAGADLITNRSVVWLYKLCDQFRESMNSVTTVMELSEPAIIVLNEIRSDTETQFTKITYASKLRKEYKRKEVAVTPRFITALADKCDDLIKSGDEVTGAEMRKLFAHISREK